MKRKSPFGRPRRSRVSGTEPKLGIRIGVCPRNSPLVERRTLADGGNEEDRQVCAVLVDVFGKAAVALIERSQTGVHLVVARIEPPIDREPMPFSDIHRTGV